MRLNLGCGNKLLNGYINVDRFGTPDVRHDLEQFPWPWPDNSVQEVCLIHVLEHLGRDTDTFKRIVQELYRVCRDRAVIHIIVPYPRHDTFLADPTHARPITEDTFRLFSRRLNFECRANGYANSCLALEWNVDFEIQDIRYHFDEYWQNKFARGDKSKDELFEIARGCWNVIESTEIHLIVVKG